MSLCAIIGDSIALGLAMANPQCEYNAKVGRTAYTISQQVIPGYHSWGVISAGSNDPYNPDLRAQLYKIRRHMNAEKVVWVAPTNPRANYIVRILAVVFQDKVVQVTPGKDGIHPKSYGSLSREIKKQL